MAKRSLKYKLWIYFSGFAAIIMAVLWLLEIIFLSTFYETMKRSEIEKLGTRLLASVERTDFEEYVMRSAFESGVQVTLFDGSGTPLTPEMRPPGRPGEWSRQSVLEAADESGEGYVCYKAETPYAGTNSIVFCGRAGAYYLLIEAPLLPIDATTSVLQNQLLIVTVLALIIAFALSYVIAGFFSKPLAKMTESAKRLGTGDYTVHFEQGSYSEVNQLAEVLNNTTQRLAKTDEMRRDLMANVTHDLKTPLTIIKSYGEMIRDLSGGNPEKRNAHAQTIVDEADRLSLLVNDILDLSRLESGAATMEVTQFSFSDTVHSVARRFALLEEREGYEITVDCAPDLYVEGDRGRMEQAIYNLIGNAVNYTGEDKRVFVAVREQGEAVYFAVTDTGPGIAPEERDLVWERYYKHSKCYQRAAHSTGIGLSIVKNILLSHKAAFGVESEVGKGSTFWFMLPRIS